jgi:hypothetical protein
MRPISALIAAAILAGSSAGCYSTWDIAPSALRALDGFREGRGRRLATEDGGEIEFTSGTEVHFTGADGLSTSASFRAVSVRGATFTGVEREYGHYVSVNLSRMRGVQATNFSVGKTVGLSVGLGLGIPLVIGGIALAVTQATQSD